MYPGVVQYWVKIVFANKLCQLYTILCVLCLYSVLRRAILVRYFLVLCSRHLRACFLNSSSNSSRSLFLGMLPTKRRWLLWDMVTPILLPFCSSVSFSWKCTTFFRGEERLYHVIQHVEKHLSSKAHIFILDTFFVSFASSVTPSRLQMTLQTLKNTLQ